MEDVVRRIEAEADRVLREVVGENVETLRSLADFSRGVGGGVGDGLAEWALREAVELMRYREATARAFLDRVRDRKLGELRRLWGLRGALRRWGIHRELWSGLDEHLLKIYGNWRELRELRRLLDDTYTTYRLYRRWREIAEIVFRWERGEIRLSARDRRRLAAELRRMGWIRWDGSRVGIVARAMVRDRRIAEDYPRLSPVVELVVAQMDALLTYNTRLIERLEGLAPILPVERFRVRGRWYTRVWVGEVHPELLENVDELRRRVALYFGSESELPIRIRLQTGPVRELEILRTREGVSWFYDSTVPLGNTVMYITGATIDGIPVIYVPRSALRKFGRRRLEGRAAAMIKLLQTTDCGAFTRRPISIYELMGLYERLGVRWPYGLAVGE